MRFIQLQITLFIATTLLCAGVAEAQNIYDFKGLRSSGELSDDFITTSTDKYMAQADSMLAGRKSKESKVTDDFLLKSNFILDEILLSGSVFVNDQVGAYVNEVLDSVLIGQPELRKQISVYITKAPEVNAFATDRGVVLVNLGLFNKIENEAQLAAILAHEVTHFDERHNLSSRLKAHEIATGKGVKKVRTIDGFLLRKHAYDRSLEYEADLKGAERMMATNYQLQALLDVFDVLEDSRNPYKNRLEGTEVLNQEEMLFSEQINPFLLEIDSLMKEQDKRFSELDDEDRDLYSTHPAVEKRKLAIKDKLEDRPLYQGKTYLVGKERFEYCQALARLEMGRMLNNNGDFGHSLFHSLLVNEDFPNHPYNDQALITALYSYTLERASSSPTVNGNKISISVSEEKGPADDNSYSMEWETIPVQQFKKALLQLNTLDLITLTYAKALEFEQRYPSDALYTKIQELLVRILIKHYNFNIDGRVPRFQEPHKWNEQISYEYFSSLITEESFQTIFDIAKRQHEIQNKTEPISSKKKPYSNQMVEGMKTQMLEENGANDILLLNPMYRTSKANANGNQYLPIESETKQKEIVEVLRSYNGYKDLHLEVLDTKSDEDKSAERFNESMLLSEWLSRLDDNNNFPLTADYQAILDLLEKREIQSVGRLAFVYYEEPKFTLRQKIGRSSLGLLIPIPINIPFYLKTFSKRRFFVSYKSLVDLKNGVVTWSEYEVRTGNKDYLPYVIQSTEVYVSETQK